MGRKNRRPPAAAAVNLCLERLRVYRRHGKLGLEDSNGAHVTPPVFDWIGRLESGCISVRIARTRACMTRQGRYMVEGYGVSLYRPVTLGGFEQMARPRREPRMFNPNGLILSHEVRK